MPNYAYLAKVLKEKARNLDLSDWDSVETLVAHEMSFYQINVAFFL